MGVTECCAKMDQKEEESPRQDEPTERKKPKKEFNYEDWQPSWQYDEVDGEELVKEKQIPEITPGSYWPQVEKDVIEETQGRKSIRREKQGLSPTIEMPKMKCEEFPDGVIRTEEGKVHNEIVAEKLPVKKSPEQEKPKSESIVLKSEKKTKEVTKPEPSLKKTSPESKKVRFVLPKSAYLTSVTNKDFADLQTNLKKELMKAKIEAKGQSGNDAVPFLIANSLYMDDYVLIFSKDFHSLHFLGKIDHSETIMSRYVIKTLNIESEDKAGIVKQVNAFLADTSTKGLVLLGCVNDRSKNKVIHFVFVGGFKSAPRYGCTALVSEKSSEIVGKLNKLLIAQKEFRASLMVYNKYFTTALAKFVIFEQTEYERKEKYTSMEFSDYDFLNMDIVKAEKAGKEFAGVLIGVSFEDSFILFLSSDQ